MLNKKNGKEKSNNINVGSIEEDIKILERFKNDEMQRDKLERDNRCGGWKIGDIYKLLELNTAIEHILSDYTRQKQINEEHQKINGELRKKVKELEKNIEKISESSSNNEELIEKLNSGETFTVNQLGFIKKNFISKQKIKDYLKEEKGRFEVYKKESEINENLKLGMYKHLGAKNMCEKILGIEKIVTLD